MSDTPTRRLPVHPLTEAMMTIAANPTNAWLAEFAERYIRERPHLEKKPVTKRRAFGFNPMKLTPEQVLERQHEMQRKVASLSSGHEATASNVGQ